MDDPPNHGDGDEDEDSGAGSGDDDAAYGQECQEEEGQTLT
jgi:hypothetical protein